MTYLGPSLGASFSFLATVLTILKVLDISFNMLHTAYLLFRFRLCACIYARLPPRGSIYLLSFAFFSAQSISCTCSHSARGARAAAHYGLGDRSNHVGECRSLPGFSSLFAAEFCNAECNATDVFVRPLVDLRSSLTVPFADSLFSSLATNIEGSEHQRRIQQKGNDFYAEVRGRLEARGWASK